MSDETDLLARAHQATSNGEWQVAHELFREADRSGLLPTSDLPRAAEVAYAAGDLDATVEAWERAHTEALRAGDDLAAAGAAVRVAMHILFDAALMAPVRGWLGRAGRLLAGREPVSVSTRGWRSSTATRGSCRATWKALGSPRDLPWRWGLDWSRPPPPSGV